jgi:hypothetical protein
MWLLGNDGDVFKGKTSHYTRFLYPREYRKLITDQASDYGFALGRSSFLAEL